MNDDIPRDMQNVDEATIQKAVNKLDKDLKSAAETLSRDEARFLVDAFYIMQENRIREDAQIRALTANAEPSVVIGWLSGQTSVLEKQIAAALDRYSNHQPIGRWARSIIGIGPIISSGLIAHIDIHKAQTASDIWSFAGLNPTVTWNKGQKRPWNAGLKTLCWKLGQSFVKFHNNPRSFYGKMYEDRKAFELAKNEAGDRAAAAAEILTKKNFGKATEAYKAYSTGKLPPGHIDARARRYVVKMFLAHFHEEWRTLEGLPLREPFAIQWLGHAHHITPAEVTAFEAKPKVDL